MRLNLHFPALPDTVCLGRRRVEWLLSCCPPWQPWPAAGCCLACCELPLPWSDRAHQAGCICNQRANGALRAASARHMDIWRLAPIDEAPAVLRTAPLCSLFCPASSSMHSTCHATFPAQSFLSASKLTSCLPAVPQFTALPPTQRINDPASQPARFLCQLFAAMSCVASIHGSGFYWKVSCLTL